MNTYMDFYRHSHRLGPDPDEFSLIGPIPYGAAVEMIKSSPVYPLGLAAMDDEDYPTLQNMAAIRITPSPTMVRTRKNVGANVGWWENAPTHKQLWVTNINGTYYLCTPKKEIK